MKTLKRILWFAMALVMVMSLGVSAFAGNVSTYDLVEDYDATYSDGTASVTADENGLYAAEAGGTVTITNTLLTDVKVIKNWADDSNRDGVRPNSLNITLKNGDDEECGTYTMTAADASADDSNVWVYTFTGLPAYKATGEKIVYTVVEESITDYKGNVGDIANGEISVTNTHENEKVTVSMTMTWVDDNDREGARGKYTVAVFNGETEVPETRIELSEYTTTYEWSLDKNDPDSHEPITYTVKEVVRPCDYTVNVVRDTEASGLAYDITNTHEISYVNVHVEKIWDDEGEVDVIRPDSVTFFLYADYHESEEENPVLVNTKKLGGTDGWEYTFTTDQNGKPLYNYANGQEVTYSIEESTVSGYVKDIDSDNDRDDYQVAGENGADKTVYMLEQTITNTYSTSGTPTSYTVKKVWDSGNTDVLKTPVTVNLYRTYGGTTQVARTAVLNSGNRWTYTFDGLPTEINGKTVTYSAREVTDLGDDWTTSHDYAALGTNSAKITNKYNGDLYNVKVALNWNDNNNQDNKRPSSVSVAIFAYDETTSTTNSLWSTSVMLSTKNNWSSIYTSMPRYSIDGNELTYKVVVAYKSDDYTISSDGEVDTINNAISFSATPDENGVINLAFTENHTPETGKVKVTKSWNGGKIDDSEIKFSLLANGSEVKTGTLSKNNGWAMTFDNLPVYENGEEISYTVVENNTPNGYTPSYSDCVMASSDVEKSTLTITNTYDPKKTGLNVTIAWDDNLDSEGFRPDEVTLTLKADGEVYKDNVSATKEDGWTYNFTDLPVYSKQGKEITYTVSQTTVDGYEAPVVGEIKDGNVTITNKRTPTYISYTVNPTWYDGNNQDGKRATTTLYLTGTATGGYSKDHGSYVLTNNLSKTFTNLPKYANGEEITYTPSIEFTEDAEGIYTYEFGTATVSETTGNYTVPVTLTHTPETIVFKGNKVWNDQYNVANKRATSVTLYLYAGEVTDKSEPVKTLTVDGNMKESTWEFEFEPVPVYANGEKIKYTVVEGSVANYKAGVVSVTGDWFVTVTNNPDFSMTTSVATTVKWEDNENDYGYRPNAVFLTLQWYKNGKWENYTYFSEATVRNTDGWAKTWKDLPKYDSDNPGTEIQYRVVEDDVTYYKDSGYGTSENSYTITNTLIATEITVTKAWQDGEDADEGRPTAIGIELYKSVNGGTPTKVGDTATLNEANEWSYTFTKLPTENADGEAITYSVKEVSAPSTGGGVINAEPIPVEE